MLAALVLKAASFADDDDPPFAITGQGPSDAAQRKTWPGLWLTGQRSLFDPDDSVARRKARSRAAGKVMDLLHDVLAELAAQGLVSGGSAREAH